MNAGEQAAVAQKRRAPRKVNRKSDGQGALRAEDRLAQIAAGQTVASTAHGPVAALTEPTTKDDGWVDPNHPARARDVVIVDAERGIVRGTRRKIAICGFASSSRHLIPVNDPAWEIWGLNQLYRHIKRADRWFDIHRHWAQDVVPGTEGTGPGSYIGWLKGCGIPFYMADREPSIPTAVRYPIEKVIAHHEADYYTSTIAIMLALAVLEIDERVDRELDEQMGALPAKELLRLRKTGTLGTWATGARKRIYETYTIGVFGVDLIVGGEYFHEKPCAEYWLGQASRSGIQVALPAETALCKQRFRYGYEREPDLIIKLSEIDNMQAQLEKDKLECVKKFDYINGAMDANSRWRELMELRLRGLGV